MTGLTGLTRRRAAVLLLAAALLVGGHGGDLVWLTGPTGLVAARADSSAEPTLSSAAPAASPTDSPAGLDNPDAASDPAPPVSARFLTEDLVKVQAKRNLTVYSAVDFVAANATGRLIRQGSRVTVHGVAASTDGTPRLVINGGFISAAKTDVARPTIDRPAARAVYAFDVQTGQVLYRHGSVKPQSVASLAKLMTALIVRQEIAAGRLRWQTKVEITDSRLVKMSQDWSAGGTPLKLHSRYSVRQLDNLALVESNNAAVTQLGLVIAGSNAAFIKLMNNKAAQLGMTSARFISISGLDNFSLAKFGFKLSGKAKDGNRVSAADIGKLAGALLTEFPEVTEQTSQTRVKVKKHQIKTTNQLLPGKFYYDATLGIDGLKTGYTGSAGYCFVGTAQQADRHRVVVVLIHAKSSADRFKSIRRLLRSAYQAYALTTPVAAT